MLEDASTYLINSASQIPGVTELLLALGGLVGFILVLMGLLNIIDFEKKGQQGQGGFGAPIAKILAGTFLMSLLQFVDMTSFTLFSNSADPRIIKTFTKAGGDDRVRLALQVIVAWVNTIGWIAVFSGLIRLATGPATGQPGWFGSSLLRIIAGTMLANLYVTANFLAGTVGGTLVGDQFFKF